MEYRQDKAKSHLSALVRCRGTNDIMVSSQYAATDPHFLCLVDLKPYFLLTATAAAAPPPPPQELFYQYFHQKWPGHYLS